MTKKADVTLLYTPERHPADRPRIKRTATPTHNKSKLVLADIDRDAHDVLRILAEEQGLTANALASSWLVEIINQKVAESVAAEFDRKEGR
jgi:hypothetical protein